MHAASTAEYRANGRSVAEEFRATPDRLAGRRVRAVVLLAGQVRPSRFYGSIGRSPLDLPAGGGTTVLDLWCRQLERLAIALEMPFLEGRILLGQNAVPPQRWIEPSCTRFSMETDPTPLRGTGGLLRDLAQAYEDDDCLVVATATQLLLEPMEQWVREAVECRHSGVALIHDVAGNPPSLFVVACRALRDLPADGFVDFKEQGLPRIAPSHAVKVLSSPQPLAITIRTAQSYLAALQQRCRRLRGVRGFDGAFTERWQADFAIVEDGAQVSEEARLHNAVVLAGAVVEPQSTVASCVVCPGARVRRLEQVCGKVITPRGSFPLTD